MTNRGYSPRAAAHHGLFHGDIGTTRVALLVPWLSRVPQWVSLAFKGYYLGSRRTWISSPGPAAIRWTVCVWVFAFSFLPFNKSAASPIIGGRGGN